MEQPPKTEGSRANGKIGQLFALASRLGWFVAALAAILVFFTTRKFFFDVVRINNRDMETNLSFGDAVLIKKRFNTYNRGDVIYFQYPVADVSTGKTFFFQRIMGLPGDTLEIDDKLVLVNGTLMDEVAGEKHNYFVTTNNAKIDSAYMQANNISEGGPVSDGFDYSFSLTKAQSEQLEDDPAVRNIELKIEEAGRYDEACFPACPAYKWNRDHYGKIYLPRKGNKLLLDTVNINLYSVIVENYEDNELEVRGDSILINGELTRSYEVKQNYYFVLGDNRDNAVDSRVWGYLPEAYIRGKIVATIKHK